MFERRSLRWPITLGVILIVLIIMLTVGWVLLTVVNLFDKPGSEALFVTLLAVGTTMLVLLLVGVVMYLALSVKAINLNRRQSNFMDSVTHELKSPIASLKLYLQTLNRRDVSAEEQEQFFRFMLDDVERLDHLINHLLDAARLDRRPAKSETEDIDLARLLEACVEEVRLHNRASKDSVRMQLEPSIVHGRPVDVEMIFRNVIDNAFKYAGDPPQVEISSRPTTDGPVVTTIKDNGCGIPQRLRSKVFRRFVRLGMELEREKPGTGLGLYIVDTLVRRLRGKVRVTGHSSGPGTTFEIQLPGRAASLSKQAPAASQQEAEIA